MQMNAFRRAGLSVLVVTSLALAGCTAKATATTAATNGAGTPSTAASPSAGSITPSTPTGPGTAPATSSTPTKPKPTATVKPVVHYIIVATHQCSWEVAANGHLTISIGFQIRPTGKNPPAGVPFTMTDGRVTMTATEPVGTPFQAVLDSGKPMSSNAWVGTVITAKVSVDAGKPNAAHASLTINGPVKGVTSGDTYCPAD